MSPTGLIPWVLQENHHVIDNDAILIIRWASIICGTDIQVPKSINDLIFPLAPQAGISVYFLCETFLTSSWWIGKTSGAGINVSQIMTDNWFWWIPDISFSSASRLTF